MPRSPRVLFDGAFYHIYQRGNNKEFIFKNPKHKAFLIKQLRDYNKRFDFQLLAYVIMDNHYHLAIKTNRDPIDKIMFNINNVVSKFLNKELNRTGHIYENRYRCELVDNDAYLIWLLRYIHRNPIRAGICEKVKDYRWNSNIFYQCNISNLIDISFILNIISPIRSQAVSKYLSLMDIPDCNSSIEDFSFIKSNFNLFEALNSSNSDGIKVFQKLTLDDILNTINISIEEKHMIMKGSKDKHLVPYKIEFIRAALLNKYSLIEISKFINIKPDALRKFRDYHKIIT